MTWEDLLGVVTAVVAVALSWADVRGKVGHMGRGVDELLKIHRDQPIESALNDHARQIQDMYAEHREALSLLAEAINGLSHYIRWLAEQQTGKQPPPPINSDVAIPAGRKR